MFALTDQPINVHALREQLTQNELCGAFNSFEGWVRRHNDGKTVDYLVYTAYAQLAQSQGEAISPKPNNALPLKTPSAYTAWVSSPSAKSPYSWALAPRTASRLCRLPFHHDTVKAEVPIWKQEFYTDGSAEQPPAWLANAEALAK